MEETFYSAKTLKQAVIAMAITVSLFWIAILGGSASCEKQAVEDTAPVQMATTGRLKYYHSNTPPSTVAGRSIAGMSETQLRDMLSSAGFRDIDNMPDAMMRRLFLAWHYKALFEQVHKRTGINESVVFAYFIYEATVGGEETDLWALHKNPGGIKFRGRGIPTAFRDDCGPVPCLFESFSSFDQAVVYWSEVFNQGRYRGCKRKQIDETCSCLKYAGYYTGKGWMNRARIARQYNTFVVHHFPII